MQKKAASYIGYILMVMITVIIATSIIIWSQRTTKELTESAVNIASGRLECKEVRIDAFASEDCGSLTVSNKGMINIENVKVTLDDARQQDSGRLVVNTELQVNDAQHPFSKAVLLPIVKEGENMFGCVDKKLTLNCS